MNFPEAEIWRLFGNSLNFWGSVAGISVAGILGIWTIFKVRRLHQLEGEILRQYDREAPEENSLVNPWKFKGDRNPFDPHFLTTPQTLIEGYGRWTRWFSLDGKNVIFSSKNNTKLVRKRGHLSRLFIPLEDLCLNVQLSRVGLSTISNERREYFDIHISCSPSENSPQNSTTLSNQTFTTSSTKTVTDSSSSNKLSELTIPKGCYALADEPRLANYLTCDPTQTVTFQEDERMIGTHPRDPYHRVDALQTTRHVRVEYKGVKLAESRNLVILFEARLPTRYYFSQSQVLCDLVVPEGESGSSICPYKGCATMYGVRIKETGEVLPKAAWIYHDPVPEMAKIKGLVSFYAELVDIFVEGEKLDPPATPWF